MNPSSSSRAFLTAELRMALSQIWIVLLVVGLPDLFGSVTALIGMTLVPGINISLFLCRGGWARTVAVTCGLAPLCAGLSGYLFCRFDWSPLLCTMAPALVTMPLAGLSVLRAPQEREKSEGGLGAALGISAILVLISLYFLASSTNIRLSSHGMLHASIVYQVMDSGLPPQNPFFAGEPLIYYWFFHLIAAGLSLGSGLSPFHAFSLINVLAVAAVMPLLYLVGRSLRLSQGVALLGAGLGLLALNPLGPVFFLIQEPNVTLDHIRAGIFPGSLLHFQSMGFDLRLASPLSKFWNVSSFPAGIALFLLGLYAGVAEFRSRGLRFCLLLITVWGLMVVNPLVGACFVVPMGVAAVVGLLGAHRPQNLITLGSLVLGGALSLPYLLSIASRAGGETSSLGSISPNMPALLGILLASGPILIFTVAGTISLIRQKNGLALQLAVFCLVLIVMALIFSLPMENEYKMIRLLVFPAGVLAGPAALLFLKRLRIPKVVAALLVALAILPNSIIAITIYACAVEASVPLDDSEQQIRVTAEAREKHEVYRYVRDETPEDAVVVVDTKDHSSAIGGKMQGDEVPCLGRRAIYTGHLFYLTENHADFRDRIERVGRLYLNQPGALPKPVDGRPLYVLVRNGMIPSAVAAPQYKEVFRSGNTALFQYMPADK